MTANARVEATAAVRRILDRYLVEIVEMYDLCPWARSARERGEVAFEVVWGAPTVDEWVAACKRALAQPEMRVAMVVAPELTIDPVKLHTLRGEVGTILSSMGIAEFHPDARLDLASPARLVPFIRRSPDPMLQLVPLSLLASVRVSSVPIDLVEQAQILGGHAPEPKVDIGDRIAETNHARVRTTHAQIDATLADIAADRARSYALAGISACR